MGQRYRAARQPIERSHLQIVWLLSQGRSEREVAAVTGYGQRWIAAIVRRYNAGGASGLGDPRGPFLDRQAVAGQHLAIEHLTRGGVDRLTRQVGNGRAGSFVLA
jgi:transposase